MIQLFLYIAIPGFLGWFVTGKLFDRYRKEDFDDWRQNQQLVLPALVMLFFLSALILDKIFVALFISYLIGYLLRVYWIIIQHDGENDEA